MPAEQKTDVIPSPSRDFTERETQHLREIIQHLRELHEQEHASIRREVKIMFEAAREAIAKAETATEKRFEGMNEWREQSSDRERSQREQMGEFSSNFMLKEVADAQFKELNSRIADLSAKLGQVVG